MKRFYFIVLFLSITMIASSLMAQKKTFMEHITLEVGGGYNMPVAPSYESISLSDYAGFRSFYLGANYDINELVGLRFTYGNNGFRDSDDSSLGLTHHKLMAEATFNIIRFIEMTYNPFEVMLHGGAGLSFGKSKQVSGIDKMGTFQLGLMPQYRITDNFRIHLDATYVINLKQNYFYEGSSFDDTGEYIMINLGIGYRF
ncbi:MAG: outer membrane beta-barrel protein [Bacteroidales bacterium]|nr:outer membrane beta-barrel protein [Bacteroidales bacterium]